MAEEIKFIEFNEVPGAPKISVPANLSNEEITDFLKSEKFENAMFEKGFHYKYGLQPVNMLKMKNLDDGSFTSSFKAGWDSVKAIGQGALANFYDFIGAKENQEEALKAAEQYMLDRSAHIFRVDKEGKLLPRPNTIEQILESEEQLAAFMNYLKYTSGNAAATSIPIALTALAGAGVGAVGGAFVGGAGAMAGARLGGYVGGALGAYAFGLGDTYLAQREAGAQDPNAYLSMALGVPYAAVEMLGVGGVFPKALSKVFVTRKAAHEALKKGAIQQIKKGTKGGLSKVPSIGARYSRGLLTTMAGEAFAETVQETLNRTAEGSVIGYDNLYSDPEFHKQLGEAAAAGFFGGFGFGLINPTIDTVKMIGKGTGPVLEGSIANADTNTDPNQSFFKDKEFTVGDTVILQNITLPTALKEKDMPLFGMKPQFQVMGTASMEGIDNYILQSLDIPGAAVMIPVTQYNNIFKFEETPKPSADEGENYVYNALKEGESTSPDKNLRDQYSNSKKALVQTGWIKNADDKVAEEYLGGRNQVINDTVHDIEVQRAQQKKSKVAPVEDSDRVGEKINLDKKGTKGTITGVMTQLGEFDNIDDATKFQVTREDGVKGTISKTKVKEFNKDEGKSISDVISLVNPLYKKYDGFAGEELKKEVTKDYTFWRDKALINKSESDAIKNNLSKEDNERLIKLGYRDGPRGNAYIDRYINRVTPTKNKRSTEGRQKLKDIIKNNEPFSSVRDIYGGPFTEKIVIGEKITETPPLTEEEKISLAGEGYVFYEADGKLIPISHHTPFYMKLKKDSVSNEDFYKIPIEERMRMALSYAEALDHRGYLRKDLKFITLISELRQSLQQKINAARSKFGPLSDALKEAQQELKDFNNTGEHIIRVESLEGEFRLWQILSPKAIATAERQIMKIQADSRYASKDPLVRNQVMPELVAYQALIKSAIIKRKQLNAMLESMSIEPITNWDKLTDTAVKKSINKLKRKLNQTETQVTKRKITETVTRLNRTQADRDTDYVVKTRDTYFSEPEIKIYADEQAPLIIETMRIMLDKMGLSTEDVAITNKVLANMDGEESIAGGRIKQETRSGLPANLPYGLIALVFELDFYQNLNDQIRRNNWVNPKMRDATIGIKNGMISRLVNTVHHEGIHALKDMGLFTDKEWAMLEREADKWIQEMRTTKTASRIDLIDIEALYRGKDKTPAERLRIQREEAIAFRFGEHVVERRLVTNPRVKNIFDRIKAFLIAFLNGLRGAGFMTPESIFDNVQAGIVGKRNQVRNETFNIYESKDRDNMMLESPKGVMVLSHNYMDTPEQRRTQQDWLEEQLGDKFIRKSVMEALREAGYTSGTPDVESLIIVVDAQGNRRQGTMEGPVVPPLETTEGMEFEKNRLNLERRARLAQLEQFLKTGQFSDLKTEGYGKTTETFNKEKSFEHQLGTTTKIKDTFKPTKLEEPIDIMLSTMIYSIIQQQYKKYKEQYPGTYILSRIPYVSEEGVALRDMKFYQEMEAAIAGMMANRIGITVKGLGRWAQIAQRFSDMWFGYEKTDKAFYDMHKKITRWGMDQEAIRKLRIPEGQDRMYQVKFGNNPQEIRWSTTAEGAMGMTGLYDKYNSMYVYMTPDQFLNLSPAFKKQMGSVVFDTTRKKSIEFITKGIMKGKKVAPPFLTIEISKDGTIGKVVNHEGRHRATIAKNINGPQSTIPVAIRFILKEDSQPFTIADQIQKLHNYINVMAGKYGETITRTHQLQNLSREIETLRTAKNYKQAHEIEKEMAWTINEFNDVLSELGEDAYILSAAELFVGMDKVFKRELAITENIFISEDKDNAYKNNKTGRQDPTHRTILSKWLEQGTLSNQDLSTKQSAYNIINTVYQSFEQNPDNSFAFSDPYINYEGPNSSMEIGDFTETEVKLSRYETREGPRTFDKAVEEVASMWDGRPGGTATIPKVSWIRSLIGHPKAFGNMNTPFQFLYHNIMNMENKARELQQYFSSILAKRFFRFWEDPAVREILQKAIIIAQMTRPTTIEGLMDEQGRVTLVAPVEGGAADMPVAQGEIVMLEGDVLGAFLDVWQVMKDVNSEWLRTEIATGYVPALVEALRVLKRQMPELPELQKGGPFDFEEMNTSQISNLLEMLDYGQLKFIRDNLSMVMAKIAMKPLSGIDTVIDPSFIGPTWTEDMGTIAQINNILGDDSSGLNKLIETAGMLEGRKLWPYSPLMRFGDFYINVYDPEDKDKVLYSEHFESRAEGFAKRDELLLKYPDAIVDQVKEKTINDIRRDIAEMKKGGKPVTLEYLAQYLSDTNAKKYQEIIQAVRKELKERKLDREVVGINQFFEERDRSVGMEGVPGYSADFVRSISQYLQIASSTLARNRYISEANKNYTRTLIYAKEQEDVNLEKMAKSYWKYVEDPVQEFAKTRRMGFWWYLGGNMSSAILQTMSMVQFTGPLLAQLVNPNFIPGKGFVPVLNALRKGATNASSMVVHGVAGERQYQDVFMDFTRVEKLPITEGAKQALYHAIADGTIKQGQAFEEAGIVPNQVYKEMGSKKGRAKAFRFLENVIIAGAFNTFEVASRASAFMAIYELAETNPKVLDNADVLYGNDMEYQLTMKQFGRNPEALARFMTSTTFGEYGKRNRQWLGRNLGSLAALFMTYMTQMMGLMYRMANPPIIKRNPTGKGFTIGIMDPTKTKAQNRAGRLAFARMMMMMVITGGLFGIPGGEDAEDLYDMTKKMLTGVESDIRTEFRNMLYEAGWGPTMIESVEKGLISSYFNIDVQRRVGFGMVPWSQQVRALLNIAGIPTGAKAEQMLGAPGSVYADAIRGWLEHGVREGDIWKAVQMSSPTFIRNILKAAEYSPYGNGFADTGYGQVLTDDISGLDLFWQSIGFTPTAIADQREAIFQERKLDKATNMKRQRINSRITNAYVDIIQGGLQHDGTKMNEGQQKIHNILMDLMDWNSTQPYHLQFTPDIKSLHNEAMMAVFPNYRILKSNRKLAAEKMKVRLSYGLD